VTQALAFLGVSAVVIVTPGPDTALTIRNALTGGRRGGVLTALGVATGQATWTLAAAAGVAAVLRASEPLFVALKLAGAAYLVFLGARTLLAALRRSSDGGGHPRSRPVAAVSGSYGQGLISNLANPKMAIFFTSLLPQFGGTSFAALFALGLVFCTMTLVWLSAYGLVVAKAGDVLRRARVRRTIDTVTGTVLVAFGLRLAAESRA
jgi:threonine/homoserine/homoserine lactone efflux protein